jgi:hypothetical protein
MSAGHDEWCWVACPHTEAPVVPVLDAVSGMDVSEAIDVIAEALHAR